MWDMQALSTEVKTYAMTDVSEPGLQALFFDGEPYEGKATRVFAWLGLPDEAKDGPVPAMVLVHGGGGTAFVDWVKLWNKRGYAAIAMDTCGCIPKGEYSNWQVHKHAGPTEPHKFDFIDKDPKDQWTYHAVAAVIRAHTLLRNMEEVDQDRIGITGISWGGYLTCITSGIDNRFKFSTPVYGCGHLDSNSAWFEEFEKLGTERAAKWLSLWDPSVYLPNAEMPMQWVTGTNDAAYPFDSVQKSYRLPKTARQLCIRLRMPHGHGGDGENPVEIHTRANQFLKGEKPLAEITEQAGDAKEVTVKFKPHRKVTSAKLLYSKHCWNWVERELTSKNATLDLENGQLTAKIPTDTEAYYVNLIHEDEQLVSSEHITLR